MEPPNAAYTTGHQARSAGGESILYSTETPVTFIVMDGGGENNNNNNNNSLLAISQEMKYIYTYKQNKTKQKGREAGEKSCECIRS